VSSVEPPLPCLSFLKLTQIPPPPSILDMLAARALLAQSDTSSVASVIIWSAILLIILILAFAVYSRFKKWMTEVEAPAATGFSFSDLRELHRQGKLSAEEYEAARLRMVASAKRMTGDLPEPLADTRKPPGHAAARPDSDPGP
jgi:hypothetical protein